MNTILITVLSAAALLPAAPPDTVVAVPPEATLPLTGKILVLTNGHTVDGDIEQIVDRYRVCRSVGETWIPGDKVLRLCADANEAYVYLRARLKPDDIEGRLLLAEWCRDHGMNAEALVETQIVLSRDKNQPLGRRLLAQLQPQTAPGSRAPIAEPPALPAPPLAPRLDLTAEALNQFATRIQPILMNACANCHNEARGTVFRLTRSYEIGIGNRTTLQQNVSAVLAYVQVDQPQASPFLTKAIGIHWWKETPEGVRVATGDPSQPPFQNRHAPAFRALEDWVRLAVSTSPQYVEIKPVVPPSPPPPPPALEPRTVPVVPSKPEGPAAEATPLPHKDDTTPLPLQPQPAAVTTAPPPPGVCDPAEFNRLNHPDRAKPSDPLPK
jgi:hypothetical protein